MKTPGPDHPISIAWNPKRVRVYFQGHILADTVSALTLKEAGYKAVQYLPREDVEMEVLAKTDHVTHCPYKGDASYYRIYRDGQFADNAVWSYEAPYPAVDAIRGMLAFYPDKVDIHEIDEGRSADDVRAAVEHTDSGSGSSQLDKWAPNVTMPGDEAGEYEDVEDIKSS